MQRIPSRQRQNLHASKMPNKPSSSNETSPVLLMARRIRTEQGVEQLKSFLAAMEPFVAPNELRTICNGFGINFDLLEKPVKQQQQSVPQTQGMPSIMNPLQAMAGRNQFQLIQMLMNMQGMMKGGNDISQIIKMMGG